MRHKIVHREILKRISQNSLSRFEWILQISSNKQDRHVNLKAQLRVAFNLEALFVINFLQVKRTAIISYVDWHIYLCHTNNLINRLHRSGRIISSKDTISHRHIAVINYIIFTLKVKGEGLCKMVSFFFILTNPSEL